MRKTRNQLRAERRHQPNMKGRLNKEEKDRLLEFLEGDDSSFEVGKEMCLSYLNRNYKETQFRKRVFAIIKRKKEREFSWLNYDTIKVGKPISPYRFVITSNTSNSTQDLTYEKLNNERSNKI